MLISCHLPGLKANNFTSRSLEGDKPHDVTNDVFEHFWAFSNPVRREDDALDQSQRISTDESHESDEESEDDTAEIPTEIGALIECLQELTPSIKICVMRAELSSMTSHPFTVSGPAFHYIQNIRDKYDQIPVQLANRLGEANWQKHIRLRQIVEHNENHGKDEREALGAAGAKSIFHDSGIGTMETASAHSARSSSSFLSNNTIGDGLGLHVPPIPVHAKSGDAFLCEFCGIIKYKIRNRVGLEVNSILI